MPSSWLQFSIRIFEDMWILALTIHALVLSSAAQNSPGIYSIGSRAFPQALVTQLGNTIPAVGAVGDIKQTWFITPAALSGQFTIQNVGTLQYMSVAGSPANGSMLLPSATPFAWTLQQNTISVNNLFITFTPGSIASLTLNSGPPENDIQQWSIAGVTPPPTVYRLLNTDTNTYLTGGRTLPAPLTATPLNATNAVQLWTIAGTGVDSRSGTLSNFNTGAFIAISSGSLGTFSTSRKFDFTWLFNTSDSGERLSSITAPSPNVISINSMGQVVLDVAGSSNTKQIWTFVPASTSGVV